MDNQSQPSMSDLPVYSNAFRGELPPLDSVTLRPGITDIQRQLARLVEQPKYFLVLIPEDGFPEVKEFERPSELVEAFRELGNGDVAVYAFLGYQLHRSVGALRYLITPLGNHKLYDEPDPAQLVKDSNAFLGRPLPLPKTTGADDPSGTNQPYRMIDMGADADDGDDEQDDIFG